MVYQDYFMDSTVHWILQNFPNRRILFISDIRTSDTKTMNSKQIEEQIKLDMENQRRWTMELRPAASMLKFRLPWPGQNSYQNDITKYYKGKIYLPVWGPQTTTECRLVVTDHSPQNLVEYNNRLYESQMFYFNIYTRVQYYDHSIDATGIDHCFDCVSEIIILGDYINRYNPPFERIEDFRNAIAHFSVDISKKCSANEHRTLDMHISFEQKKSWF